MQSELLIAIHELNQPRSSETTSQLAVDGLGEEAVYNSGGVPLSFSSIRGSVNLLRLKNRSSGSL